MSLQVVGLPDKRHMHAHAAVHGTAIETNVHPVRQRKPRWISLAAIKAYFVVRLGPQLLENSIFFRGGKVVFVGHSRSEGCRTESERLCKKER